MNFVAPPTRDVAPLFATAPPKSLITKEWLGRKSNPRYDSALNVESLLSVDKHLKTFANLGGHSDFYSYYKAVPSLTKDSRARSPYWICCYTAADGRQLKRSTKQTAKEKAWEVCLAFSRAEGFARAGEATASQLRRVLNETLYRVGAESLQRPSVRQWLNDWLSGRKGVAAHGTLLKYRQVVDQFLSFLGKQADAKLESLGQGEFTRFRDTLLAEGRTPQTVNGLVRKVLNAPFSLALRMGVIAVNPIAALPLYALQRQRKAFSPRSTSTSFSRRLQPTGRVRFSPDSIQGRDCGTW